MAIGDRHRSPGHAPVVAEISLRCFTVPEIAGSSRLTGARRPTVAVSTEAADVEPAELRRSTTTPRILEPTSAAVSV